MQPTPINTLIESGFVKILFSVGSLYSEIPILSFEFQNVNAETWSVVKNVPTLGSTSGYNQKYTGTFWEAGNRFAK